MVSGYFSFDFGELFTPKENGSFHDRHKNCYFSYTYTHIRSLRQIKFK